MNPIPIYIVTHHKCASTWLRRYIMEFCSLNSLEIFTTHYSYVAPVFPCDIAVLGNASYDFLNERAVKGIHVIRNPLDVIVSAYYSHMNTHPLAGWPRLSGQRQALRSVDKDKGLLLTLQFLERGDF